MLFSFDDLSLDRDRRELRRGADAIAVEPQVFDLLVYLIENRDRVVSRDDLIAAVWDGRIVSESTLASRISAARLAVGDSGKVQRLIKTIPRKGFCFVGDISEEAKRRTPQSNAAVIPIPAQSISFCRTSDGVSIALATAGAGPVLMKTGHWLSHLEYDWQSPIWSPMYARPRRAFGSCAMTGAAMASVTGTSGYFLRGDRARSGCGGCRARVEPLCPARTVAGGGRRDLVRSAPSAACVGSDHLWRLRARPQPARFTR